MKKHLIILTILAVFSLANAQQQYQVSQYMFTPMSFNPAYAGSQEQIEIDGLDRQQWMGFPGRPKTFTMNASAAVHPFKTQGGVGISIVQDKIAINKVISMALTYAYRFNVGNGKLAIGAKLGFMNNTTDYTGLTTKESITLPTTKGNGMAFPDLDVGIYYNTEKTYLGISSMHMTTPTVKYKVDGINYKLSRAYIATAGYKHQLANPLFELQPSLFFLSDGSISYMDFTTLVAFNKKLWGGMSYRSGNNIVGNAVIMVLGIEMKNGLKVGYSYDFVTSSLRKYNTGSHEFTFRYSFKVNNEKIPQKYKSVRFL